MKLGELMSRDVVTIRPAGSCLDAVVRMQRARPMRVSAIARGRCASTAWGPCR